MAQFVKTTALECPSQQAMDVEALPATTPGLMLYPDLCRMDEGVHCMPSTYDQLKVDVNTLRPCFGTIFQVCSLYCDCPKCFGVSGRSEVLCFMQSCACYKILDCSDAEKRCCALENNNCYCIQPRTICQNQFQCCCCDVRAALPCSSDVPALINIAGCNICANGAAKCACCATVGELTGASKE